MTIEIKNEFKNELCIICRNMLGPERTSDDGIGSYWGFRFLKSLRSKKLISLCKEDERQESINRLAEELERESALLLLQPSVILPSNSEDQDTMGISSVLSEHPDNISTAGSEIIAINTGTTQSIITTTVDISEIVNPSLITQNISEIPTNRILSPCDSNEVSYQLNDQTGCLEPIVVKKDNISSNIPEEESLSETRKRKQNKNMRLLGKRYKGHKVKKVDDITKLEEILKSDRQLKEKPCNHGAEKKSDRSYLCAAINDDIRNDCFKYFWQLPSWDAKKAYINGLIQARNILRRRTSSVVQKKSFGYDCYLPSTTGDKFRVCKELFLATFDLKKDMFQLWIRSNINISESSAETSFRRMNEVPNTSEPTTRALKSDSVLKWLECVPKVPSHYCRANSSRIYVDESFESFTHMHSVYSSWCQDSNVDSVKRKKFQEILKEAKISIFKPRKDQCDICVAHKQGNIPDDRRTTTASTREPMRLYDGPLKIDSTKFCHLQSLKQYMHRDYHLFYDNLNH
ncbi:hypothetical protein HW555_013085 [Spodoptera exigua]|uniref:Uncharacterized protein n=1 Tax=Spodoptera exigua TaxID=7107 RepID=A0A835G5T3_SPOEX|nr:hypothetical protein HW555_013085 [Spodoptera exigua]